MSNRLRTRLAVAGFAEPCLPTRIAQPPSGAQWVHEIKHDGFRFQARRNAAGVRLLTRYGNDWTTRFPAVHDAVWALKVRSCVIDGELVVLDDSGLAVFDLLRNGARVNSAACLIAFDLLELDGEDLRPRPTSGARPSWPSCCAAHRPGFSYASTCRATARQSSSTLAGSAARASFQSGSARRTDPVARVTG
jgi:ATP-dependent DNA ligase